MADCYRGEIRVQGRALRGWLAKVNAPTERVVFDVVIDGVSRGSYVADKVHGSLERQSAFGDGLHGFAFIMDRGWITGAQQSVALLVDGNSSGIELHGALGPAAATYFDENGGKAAPKRVLSAEESTAQRELMDLRRRRNDRTAQGDRAETDKRYFQLLDAASRRETPETGWSRSLLLARELYEDGRYAETVAVADRVLKADPGSFRLLLAKGRSLIALNRPAEAREAFLRAQRIDPENLAAQANARVAATLSRDPPRTSVTHSDVPLLVAVGGGLGDLLHATPMIRNISRRMGTRVDLVIAEEYPDNLFLLQHPEYVNHIYSLGQEILARHYPTVFVSHFFGELRPPFRGDRIAWSRARDRLLPGSAHETLFNLESARALLNIPYEQDDATHYYIGDFQYQPPAKPLVGLHAGSKSGHWTVKRWPHFAALAERLGARGIRVASFGIADEYVPGTENRTGGTIREMCQSMLACSFFVSNDSGVMNVANALGIPLLALFAPTDAATLLPLRPTSTAIALEKACSPCHRKNHDLFLSGSCRCIGEIGIDAVERQIVERLAGASAERLVYVRPGPIG